MTETEPWSYYPDGSPVYSLADIIRQRAAASPARVALAEPGRLTSFADLDRRSSQVAEALQRKGVAPGDRVAFVGASGPEFAEVLYGTAKCRAIFTAVNNRLYAREVLAILADVEPTSGTTGTPKGVELTGRNLGCALHELHAGIGLDENSVCAAPIPFFHVAGLGLFLAADLNGGSLLLKQPPDTLGVLNMLVDREVTHAAVVPTVLQRLLARPEAKTADWSALKYVVYGASPIPLPVLREATEVIGCSFLQSYGLTESTGGFTLLGPADHVPDEKYAHRLRSAGRPMTGARVRVVDPVTLADRPVGERGEVLVAGSRIMKGYWRKPEQTAEVMLPGGWLRTGDGGSFDADGFLYLHDRLKDMIVSGGENVYPAEVESVMTGHPAVAEVAVVSVPSAEWGESPYAVVVLRPGTQISADELISWTKDRLAHYKCPVGVTFASSLARTASGKLQKQAIRSSHGPRPVP
jgi:acyl-CoA synthetase (AMP-forming)/AMP-acid ligase II